MEKRYIPLHLHTQLSNAFTTLDSVNSYDQYIDIAKENGMKAIAFTEHGNVLEFLHKKTYAEKSGLKYIHGVEAYVTESLEDNLYDNYHVILLATNYKSFKEINYLISQASVRDNKHVYTKYLSEDKHYHYQPRITYDMLKNTSDDIIILTACLGGILGQASEEMKQDFIKFMSKNKHRCFIEIAPHNVDAQKKYNEYLINIANENNLEIVATSDVHALNEDYMMGRKILQQAKDIHFANEEEWDLTFKTHEQMIEAFKKQGTVNKEIYMKAIEKTSEIADMVDEFKLDYSLKYPHLYKNPKQEILRRIKEGIVWRKSEGMKINNELKERIKYELDVYEANDAFNFLLVDADVKKFCRDNGIEYGESRGSVAGSQIAYLMGITHIDAIKWNLIFERFMSKHRVGGLADIDTDYDPNDIPRIKEYLFNREDIVCADIVTYNTIALKGAIRDVGRGLKIDSNLIDEIAKNIEDNEKRYRNEHPELFKYVDMLNGTIVSIGNHPAGTIITDRNIIEELGIFYTKENPYPIIQINMKEVESLMYLKLDLLKLDMIGIINKTCEIAGIERIRPYNIDFTDNNVWDSMLDSTAMIFQWESTTAERYYRNLFSSKTISKLKEYVPNIDLINLFSIGNGAIRPSGDSYRDELAKGEVVNYGHKALNEFLSPTFTRLVFQEQIISFLNKFCGFSMGEADTVRRGFAKKTGTEQYLPTIKSGFCKYMYDEYGMVEQESEQLAESFLRVIEDSSFYLFSLNHSQPYSIIGYESAWLRYYYPVEFIATYLEYSKDKEEKTIRAIEYANSKGIKIKPPKFRYSTAKYTPDKSTNSIYKGISSIKFLSDNIADELYALRDNQYNSFTDLLVDIKSKTSVDTRQLNILTILGFFSEFGKNKKLLTVIEAYDKIGSRKQLKIAELESLIVPSEIIYRHAQTQTEKMLKDFNGIDIVREFESTVEDKSIGLKERLKFEAENMGYIAFTYEKATKNIYYVLDITTYKDKSKPYLTLYQVKTGDTIKAKIANGEVYMSAPFKKDDVLVVEKMTQRPKSKLENGKWVRSKTEKDNILEAYQVF